LAPNVNLRTSVRTRRCIIRCTIRCGIRRTIVGADVHGTAVSHRTDSFSTGDRMPHTASRRSNVARQQRGGRSGPAVASYGSIVLAAALALAACSGSTGSSGPAGATGAAGPSATNGVHDVTTATTITGTITAVNVNGPPVVDFMLVDQNGGPLSGLPAADISWAIARLAPGQDGSSSTWASYIFSSVTPSGCPTGVSVCATAPQVQAGVESGSEPGLVDHGDGSYTYTFTTDITRIPGLAYNPALTHRVGFEIRGLAPANNGAYTFQPSTGATGGIFTDDIVATSTCDSCHTQLAAHGGARVEVKYCVLCHNPGTTDPYSGNSLDMAVMIHKIHAGSDLPSISNYVTGTSDPTPILGQGYWIVGYRKSLSNFNTVVYPQDTRNCVACHAQDLPSAPQAAEYITLPTMQSCGACHDNINFATGANHASGIIANNTQCSTCHGPTSTIDGGQLQVLAAHVDPVLVYQKKFSYNILSATNTGPGQFPVIRFSVTDPTNGDAPWNLLTSEPFTYCAGSDPTSNSNLAIAWSTTDYTNVGSGVTSEAAEPVSIPVACASIPPTANGDGSYTVTSTTAIPANVVGTAGVLFQGHPGHTFAGTLGLQEIPVPNAVGYAAITDPIATPRRTIASVAACNVCHFQLNAHGNNRVDSVQGCAFCHNPDATDVVAREALGITPANLDPTDGLAEQTIDLKVLIHAVHASALRTTPYVVYHRGAANNFAAETPFPGLLNNCLACHAAGTFYPTDPATSTTLATTISTYVGGVGDSPPAGQTAVTAGAAVCSSCHQAAIAHTHMLQNGANFGAIKNAGSQVVSNETCAICHGPGGVADVAVVHNIAALQPAVQAALEPALPH
jgi:OmcA/MtrC family decaheme c-type cytochrome